MRIVLQCYCATVLLLATTALAQAAFEAKPFSARATGMGGAQTALAEEALSVYSNPAGLAGLKVWELGASQTSLLGEKDLGFVLFASALPTKAGTLGFAYDQFGPEEYRETEMIASHAFSLADKLDLGYSLKFLSLSLGGGLGRAQALAWDVGAKARLHKKLAVGFFGRNINQPTLGQSTEAPQGSLGLGLAFKPFWSWRLALDAEKTPRFPASVKLGQEWEVLRYFLFRSGFQTNPRRYAFGLGFNTPYLRLDYSFLTHAVLEDQHQFTVSISGWKP